MTKEAMAATVEATKPAKKEEKVEKKPRVTKKSVVIELISKGNGATVNQIAEEIVRRGIDPDLEKNKRVVRLWLSKLGMPVQRDKETGKYTPLKKRS